MQRLRRERMDSVGENMEEQAKRKRRRGIDRNGGKGGVQKEQQDG